MQRCSWLQHERRCTRLARLWSEICIHALHHALGGQAHPGSTASVLRAPIARPRSSFHPSSLLGALLLLGIFLWENASSKTDGKLLLKGWACLRAESLYHHVVHVPLCSVAHIGPVVLNEYLNL